jgi:hypothetical protein
VNPLIKLKFFLSDATTVISEILWLLEIFANLATVRETQTLTFQTGVIIEQVI